jgi:hypothetical protein
LRRDDGGAEVSGEFVEARGDTAEVLELAEEALDESLGGRQAVQQRGT